MACLLYDLGTVCRASHFLMSSAVVCDNRHHFFCSCYNSTLFLFASKACNALTLTMPNFLNGIIHQQYRAWSDCTDVQAGLALHWWQRLLTFGVGRIRVNNKQTVTQTKKTFT